MCEDWTGCVIDATKGVDHIDKRYKGYIIISTDILTISSSWGSIWFHEFVTSCTLWPRLNNKVFSVWFRLGLEQVEECLDNFQLLLFIRCQEFRDLTEFSSINRCGTWWLLLAFMRLEISYKISWHDDFWMTQMILNDLKWLRSNFLKLAWWFLMTPFPTFEY